MPETQVPGLLLYENVLSPELEAAIITDLDTRPWDTRIQRRTQHYGYRYPYGGEKRLVSVNSPGASQLAGLYSFSDNPYIVQLQNYMRDNFKLTLDQAIVNEYYHDTGIGKHIDDPILFEEPIVAFSLGSPTVMKFRNRYDKTEIHDIVLSSRSLVIMTGNSRYNYTHEIPRTKTSTIDGQRIPKDDDDYRTISVTYRKVKQLKY